MGTNYKRFKYPGSFGNVHATSMEYLAHKDEPIDEYMTSLAKGSAVGQPDNSNNLFDDSAIEDKRWTQMARRFLKHTKRR